MESREDSPDRARTEHRRLACCSRSRVHIVVVAARGRHLTIDSARSSTRSVAADRDDDGSVAVTVTSGAGRATAAGGRQWRQAARPRARQKPWLLAPTSIPTAPPVAAADGAFRRRRVRVGGPNRRRRRGRPRESTPGIPDPRVALIQRRSDRLPHSQAQRADSAVQAHLGTTTTQCARRRRIADGSPATGRSRKDGDKWGWDRNSIYLGKFAIPNAVLAALPLNIGSDPAAA